MVKRYLEEYDKDGRKNRILLVDVVCKNFSTGKIVYDLFKGIKADGREAKVFYGRGEKILEDDIYKFGLDWETCIHAAMSRITGYNGCFSPLSTYRLLRAIEEYKPDLVHIHELHDYFLNIEQFMRYLRINQIPIIHTLHCEYTYTGKCGYANECMRYESECGKCPALHDYPKSLFFDRTRQMLKKKKEMFSGLDLRIITPSKWLADRVEKSFLRDYPLSIVYNGIDTNIFHPEDTDGLREKFKIPNGNKVALSLALDIMSDRKGGKWVIKLADIMKNEKITFLIAGAYEYEKKLADNYPNVRIMGVIRDQNCLAKLYSLADVFILCSKRETFSMVCAEALCCGTPVVGFKSGAPETVFDEPIARFVNYGNVEKIREIIKLEIEQN